MASNKNTNITFFDIPTALPDKRSTSPFTWKVRFVLNYKKLNYTTVWVKSPHVRQTCIDNGFKPTGKLPDGSLHYTLPVIIDKTDAANPVVIADSNDIIQYLETRYPPSDLSLSLLPYTAGTGAGVAPALHMIFERYTSSNFQIFIPLVMEFNVKKLPADSIAFYEKTIKERFGKELSQLSPGPIGSKEREEAWSKAEEAFAGLGDCLDKNSGGIWLMGERPTLADIHLLGMLMSLKVGSEEAWERVSKWDGGRWGRYMDAAKEFSAVN